MRTLQYCRGPNLQETQSKRGLVSLVSEEYRRLKLGLPSLPSLADTAADTAARLQQVACDPEGVVKNNKIHTHTHTCIDLK